MIERLTRNPIPWALGALAAAFLLVNTIKVVPETTQGVVLQLGEPVSLVNRYEPGKRFGETGAGLLAVIPFFESVVWIDKRTRDVDMQNQQVLSTDQYRLNVDAYARYRIVDPLRMYTATRTEEGMERQLSSILGSVVRSELGKRQYVELLSPERGIIMDNIRRTLAVQARAYGVEIVDVRIKRTDPPEGGPLQAAYDRMRSARYQEARTIEAEGYKNAQIIKADADAKAAGIYAAAFGKDKDFYDFYRAMQSYERTFGTDGTTPQGQSSIILSPNNDYLREFRGGKR